MKHLKELFTTIYMQIFAALACVSGGLLALNAYLGQSGTVGAVAGSPDHTYATGSGEIPVLFADKTVEVFYDVSVAPFVANSDYEG